MDEHRTKKGQGPRQGKRGQPNDWDTCSQGQGWKGRELTSFQKQFFIFRLLWNRKVIAGPAQISRYCESLEYYFLRNNNRKTEYFMTDQKFCLIIAVYTKKHYYLVVVEIAYEKRI